MYLPCYRLPDAHRLLVEKGLIKRMEVRPGYLDAMKPLRRALERVDFSFVYAEVRFPGIASLNRATISCCIKAQAGSGRTLSAPRRPSAVPTRMPATATKDASASVENPVRPCPIEQPNAITPPDAHQRGAAGRTQHVARRR